MTTTSAPLVIRGDARALPLPDCSVDAVVCDPPYELSFMGRSWDSTGVAFDTEPWREALRVLKPGGHLAAFGATRTYHRLGCAIEDAGFEVRDSIRAGVYAWIHGQGFPKSLDVGKAIDKAAGATREVVGVHRRHGGGSASSGSMAGDLGTASELPLTAPATDAARTWDGWGTALKPAWEPIVVARKPLDGTVAASVLAHGTGAINIDGCRVEWPDGKKPEIGTPGWGGPAKRLNAAPGGGGVTVDRSPPSDAGRFPSNLLISHHPGCGDGCHELCHVRALDEQSGTLTSGTLAAHHKRHTAGGNGETHGAMAGIIGESYGDTGGASRYYPTFRYEPKAPTWQRPQVDGRGFETVKPLDLMRWLVRLLTPPSGLVLDMFPGTGTTGQAAELEGFRSLLVELEAAHIPFIRERLAQQVVVDRKTDEAVPVTPPPNDALSLFDLEAS